MYQFRQAAKILGVDKPSHRFVSDVQFLGQIDKGLPVKCLDVIANTICPSDNNFKYRIVPKATVARRKLRQKKLSPAQSVIVARLAAIWELALRIWKTPEQTRGFLYRSHPLLEGRRPIDVALENELGGELV